MNKVRKRSLRLKVQVADAIRKRRSGKEQTHVSLHSLRHDPREPNKKTSWSSRRGFFGFLDGIKSFCNKKNIQFACVVTCCEQHETKN